MKVPVYDIVSCGPRKRFVANGKVVHNSDSLNAQNMTRGSFLRQSIEPPPGHVIVAGDLGQIEPRVLAWQADYTELLESFASGDDVYAQFGAQMFGIPGLTKETHPALRQSAKSALLGAGYVLGWAAFAAQLLTGFLGAPPVLYDKAFAKQLGVTVRDVERFIGWDENIAKMERIPHTCTTEELLVHCLAAKAIIDKYRATAQPVVQLWSLYGSLIHSALYNGEEYTHKGMVFRKEEILLPSGLSLRYPNLTPSKDEKGRVQWKFGPSLDKRLHLGTICENATQALARIVMSDGMLRVDKRYPVVGTVHDELLAIVPEEEAEEASRWIEQQMTIAPVWMPGVPLTAGVAYGKNYGECK